MRIICAFLASEKFVGKMSILNWSNQGLEDSDLPKKLYDVRDYKEYKKLDLSHNKLTAIPNLRKFRQFDHLKVLSLSDNSIINTDFSLIPPRVTQLSLSRNKLISIGNLGCCSELKYLFVRSNQIIHVDWTNLPPALTWLHLENNQLTTVDASHCTQLKWLNLSDNHTLHTIQSLPNTDFDFDINSSVKVLAQKCFHENTCNMLKNKCNELKWQLDQPPVEVLFQGLEAVLEYYKEESIRTTHTR